MNIKLLLFTVLCSSLFCSCIGIKNVKNQIIENNVKEKELYFRKNFTERDLNRFSIAVIPDVQGYTHILSQNWNKPDLNYGYIFYRQTKFIANNSKKNGGDFSCAIQVGDLVHQKGNLKSEWEIAELCMSNLIDEIPLLVVPGNHDYDKWIKKNNINGSQTYNYYFGPESKFFKDKHWYGTSSADGRNSWITFNACNYNFLVLGLEICPSKESLKWAQNVINEHKSWPTIFVIHEFLTATKRNTEEPYKNAKYTSVSSREMFDHTSPENVWKTFISQNDQIFMIICGHSSTKETGSALRIDKNDFNNTTYSILSDYQEASDYLKRNSYTPIIPQFCGDGWMTIIDFDLDSKNIYVHTYSTEFDEFRTDNYAELALPIDWEWDERFSK